MIVALGCELQFANDVPILMKAGTVLMGPAQSAELPNLQTPLCPACTSPAACNAGAKRIAAGRHATLALAADITMARFWGGTNFSGCAGGLTDHASRSSRPRQAR